MRRIVYVGFVLSLLGLWVADRQTLSRRFAKHEKHAFEDSLVRQLAVVEREHAQLLEAFAEAATDDPATLDKFLLGRITEQLVRLWKYEKDIDRGRAERATVSGKRLLDALNCEQPDDFFDLAEEIARRYFEVDRFRRTAFLEMNEEELASFCDFLQRASQDKVARGDDFGDQMQNAPGELRLF